MSRITGVFLLVSVLFLGSCGGSQDSTIQELRQQIQIEKQTTENERQSRAAAQQDAAKLKSHFNLLLGISISATFLALLIGVAMGSKARNDARKPSERKEIAEHESTKSPEEK